MTDTNIPDSELLRRERKEKGGGLTIVGVGAVCQCHSDDAGDTSAVL